MPRRLYTATRIDLENDPQEQEIQSMTTLLDLIKCDGKASQVADADEAPESVAIKAGCSSTTCATVPWGLEPLQGPAERSAR